MNTKRAKTLMGHRSRQSHTSLLAAEKLAELKLWRDSVNRSYYAMYYAVMMALAYRGLVTSGHVESLKIFDREFIETGDLPRELSSTLRKCYEIRIETDFGEMVEISQSHATDMIEKSRSVISSIEAFLKAAGEPS
jgi:uncharacterized protein (UPF0332 family)